MNDPRIILLEFNELCPTLLDRWMAEGKLPTFKSFHARSQVFVSEADEAEAPYLEPWIQWYSVHTGLSYKQHGVFHLTDGPSAGHEDIWRMLLRHGKRVGCFASMNAARFEAPGSFFVPDPWCTSEEPSPAELKTYQRIVAERVQEYTNASKQMRVLEYLSFGKFMATHGLKPDTVLTILRQLASERRHPQAAWKRAPLLDVLQFDIFRHYYLHSNPSFASFFINSTAHYQHAYWRNMQPELFKEGVSADENREYGAAILFGYQRMDRLLGKFLSLAGPNTTLILSTALSQQPYLKYEEKGGAHFWRPHDVDQLLQKLGVVYQKVGPVMTHQYVIHFADPEKMQKARALMENTTLNGAPLFGFGDALPGTIYFDNRVRSPVVKGTPVKLPDGRELDYHGLFYKIPEMKSGRHHPDGALWIRTGKPMVHSNKVSILDILPTVLGFFGLRQEKNGTQTLSGRDLSPLFLRAAA